MKTNNVEMNAVEKPDIKSELVFPNEALAICCLRISEMKVWSAFAARGTANACTPLAQSARPHYQAAIDVNMFTLLSRLTLTRWSDLLWGQQLKSNMLQRDAVNRKDTFL